MQRQAIVQPPSHPYYISIIENISLRSNFSISPTFTIQQRLVSGTYDMDSDRAGRPTTQCRGKIMVIPEAADLKTSRTKRRILDWFIDCVHRRQTKKLADRIFNQIKVMIMLIHTVSRLFYRLVQYVEASPSVHVFPSQIVQIRRLLDKLYCTWLDTIYCGALSQSATRR